MGRFVCYICLYICLYLFCFLYICSTFSFSRRTLRREAGLVLKYVANLCRYRYLPRRYLPGGDRQIVVSAWPKADYSLAAC